MGRVPRPMGSARRAPISRIGNPLGEIEAGAPAPLAVEPDGVFEPTLPREPVMFWRPNGPETELLAALVRDLGAFLADTDLRWLDSRLVVLGGTAPPDLARDRVACRATSVEQAPGAGELRLRWPNAPRAGAAALDSYVTLSHSRAVGGQVRSLALAGFPPVARLAVADGVWRSGDDATLELELGEAALGLSARLASGERLAPVHIWFGAEGQAQAELAVVDDLALLRLAVGRMVEAARDDPEAALATGPFRRAVLAEFDTALGQP